MDLERMTAEQHLQAQTAIFQDDSLPFDTTCPASIKVRSTSPGCITVWREDSVVFDFPGLHTIGGLDISFRDSSGEEGVAVLAILSYPDLKLVKSISRQISLKSTPYVHSFLSFRESDHYVSLLRELENSGEALPQVLLVDGNGRWHSRQAGSAVSLGVKTGLPTIGVAKEYHPIHSTNPLDDALVTEADASLYPRDFLMSQKGMRKACQTLLERRGHWIGLPGLAQENDSDGNVVDSWGAALLASPARSASNPTFVSPGHLVSLGTSVRLALACSTNGKVPEPIRQADSIGRAEVKKIWG